MVFHFLYQCQIEYEFRHLQCRHRNHSGQSLHQGINLWMLLELPVKIRLGPLSNFWNKLWWTISELIVGRWVCTRFELSSSTHLLLHPLKAHLLSSTHSYRNNIIIMFLSGGMLWVLFWLGFYFVKGCMVHRILRIQVKGVWGLYLDVNENIQIFFNLFCDLIASWIWGSFVSKIIYVTVVAQTCWFVNLNGDVWASLAKRSLGAVWFCETTLGAKFSDKPRIMLPFLICSVWSGGFTVNTPPLRIPPLQKLPNRKSRFR